MNKSPSVLIVEDEATMVMLFIRKLKKKGFIVTGTASTKDEAVRLAYGHIPDFILMDIRLIGDKDGIDAALEICSSMKTRIIFLTGYSDEETKQRALKVNPLAFFVKPFEINELITLMENAV